MLALPLSLYLPLRAKLYAPAERADTLPLQKKIVLEGKILYQENHIFLYSHLMQLAVWLFSHFLLPVFTELELLKNLWGLGTE